LLIKPHADGCIVDADLKAPRTNRLQTPRK
jgi:hypothetical protein